MKRHLPSISILLLVFICACSPQKKMMREALILENGGLKEDAFKQYESIYNGWNNAQARVGMRRTAQEMLNLKLSEARMACMSGNFETALRLYEDAFAYEQRFRNLELQSGALAQEAYQQCRQDFIQFLYNEAEEKVLSEEFEEAHRLINKIYSLDRNNKKAQYLDMMCEILPNYNAGSQAYELGMYRDAYVYFNEVTRIDAAFRDARELKEKCIELAGYTIAFINIDNTHVSNSLELTLAASIKDHILQLKDPFIQLVERDNIDQLLLEQQASMEGIFDENTAIEAGKLIGARYLVTGEVISFASDLSRLQEKQRKGFLGNNVKAKHIRYMEYSRSRNLNAAFRYQLVDALTGRIYASQTIPFNQTDKAVWVEFEGDPELVYPGEWKYQLISSQEDYVDVDKKEDLQKSFKSKREPMTEMEMQIQLSEYIGSQVAEAVAAFRPEE